MAREPITILKEQLGNLMAEVAMLLSELEKRSERIAELEKLVPEQAKEKANA